MKHPYTFVHSNKPHCYYDNILNSYFTFNIQVQHSVLAVVHKCVNRASYYTILPTSPQATQAVSWMHLDGDLCGQWMEVIPELLGQSRTLTLGNGEHLFMSQNKLKLIFETGNLEQASPACLLNCVSGLGLVYAQ